MKSRILIIVGFLLVVSILSVGAQEESYQLIAEDNKYKIKDKNDFEIEFEEVLIYFNELVDQKLKYDIEFIDYDDKLERYVGYITSVDPIIKLNNQNYVIRDKKLYFDPYYYIIGYDEIGKEIESEKQVEVIYLDKHKLKIISNISYYDPLITQWDNGSDTAYLPINEGSGDTLTDEGNHANSHDFSKSDGTSNWVTGLDDYGMFFDGSTYFTADDSTESDFGGGSMFEINFVYNHSGINTAQHIYSSDNSDNRINIENDELGWFINSASQCNFWYSQNNMSLTTGQIYNITMTYDGSRCKAYVNGDAVAEDAASGTIPTTSSYVRIGMSDTNKILNSTIYCMGIWADATLSESARSSFFQECYGVDDCVESLINTTWTSWVSNSTCRIDGTEQYVRNRTTYDENNCGFENVTFYEVNETDYNCCYQLETPTNLINFTQDNESITLDWDEVSGASNYSIYNFSVNFINDTLPTFVHPSLGNNSLYCYNLTANNDSCVIRSSNFSNTICTYTYQNTDIPVTPDPEVLYPACEDTDYECRLNNMEREDFMMWYSFVMLGFLVFGYYSATNYNYGFGAPFIMMGILMQFKYVLDYIKTNEWWLAWLFVGLMFVSMISLWYLKRHSSTIKWLNSPVKIKIQK